MRKKYVIFNDCFPVVFTDPISHKAIADCFPRMKVTSAAFYTVVYSHRGGRIAVFGGSVSLQISHKSDDFEILKLLLE
jgi:hypothetical protein